MARENGNASVREREGANVASVAASGHFKAVSYCKPRSRSRNSSMLTYHHAHGRPGSALKLADSCQPAVGSAKVPLPGTRGADECIE